MQPEPRWSAGPRSTSFDEGLHETFARIASSRPDATALVSREGLVSYAELDLTATAWASALASAGVSPRDQVPILLPRSVELVTALLAVLKAGAAYALLDPTWPRTRIDEVTDELAAPLLVGAAGTHRGHRHVWSPPTEPVQVPVRWRPAVVDGAAPSCVFFTSGSSGRPKGVVAPHRATARLFGPNSFARFGVDTVIPLAAPSPWDAFSLELWSALLNGGTSVIVDEPFLSAQSLRSGVTEHGVETVWLTSSLLNMVVDEDLESFEGLRQVMVGGERLSSAHIARFLRRYPDIALVNGYGPVESTVFAATHRISPADCESPDGIPIGRPVPGTDIHVLDGANRCAVGTTGEICIAGEGLALRYLGDDALTEAAFAHLVLDGQPVRVYRTGDLGAWDPDGLLRFRGRADRQLKIRGHRVEPAEVERQVERLLPSVHACRVVARTGDSGNAPELVAFCVPVERGDPLANALPVLRKRLVAYQRPVQLVSVDAFPVTAQGKLDERALLASGASSGRRATAARPHAAEPGDATLRLVAQTFSAVLGGEPEVPVEVPFFDLGGDSLGAGRVCARLATALRRPVPVSRLYRHPSATSLASWLRSSAAAAKRVPGTAAATAAPPPSTPLTPMQVIYLTRHLVDPADLTGHCLLMWALEGDLNLDALDAAVAQVHNRHEPLRAAYRPDPRPAAVLVDIPAPPLEVFAERSSTSAAIDALRSELADALQPIDADVWRAALVPVSGGVAVLGIIVHHIAFDGWSESVLAADLAAAYSATRNARTSTAPMARATPDAPATSLSMVHYAHEEQAAHADLAGQTARLREELAELPILRWPAGPPARTPSSPQRREPPAHVEALLDADVVAGVDVLASVPGVTRFVVLLTLWGRALSAVTEQCDLAVGVPVAQRFGAATEHAIGCFMNIVCVRLRGAALSSGRDAFAATGQAVQRSFAAQDVQFADVVELLGQARTGRPPVFQTLFALQNNAPPRLELAGVRTRLLRQPYLDLPLELHAELWPTGNGMIRAVISWRPEAVAEQTARQLCAVFTEGVRTAASGAGR